MSFALRILAVLLLPNFVLAATYQRPELAIIEQALAPYRAHFSATIKAHPRLNESFAAYSKKVVDIIRDNKLTVKQRSKLISRANAAQKADLALLIALSKVSRREFLRKTGEAVATAHKKTGRKFNWSVGQSFEVFIQAEPQPLPAEPLAPVTTLFEPPFEGNNFFEIGDARKVDLSEGTYSAAADSAIATGGREEAGISHFFTAPEGYNRIQFKPSVGNAKVSLFVVGVAGFSSASAHSDVIIARNGVNQCSVSFDHGSLIAVIAWAAEDDHGDTFDLPCTIRPGAGREYVGTLSSTTETIGGGIAGAVSAILVSVRNFKVISFND